MQTVGPENFDGSKLLLQCSRHDPIRRHADVPNVSTEQHRQHYNGVRTNFFVRFRSPSSEHSTIHISAPIKGIMKHLSHCGFSHPPSNPRVSFFHERPREKVGKSTETFIFASFLHSLSLSPPRDQEDDMYNKRNSSERAPVSCLSCCFPES